MEKAKYFFLIFLCAKLLLLIFTLFFFPFLKTPFEEVKGLKDGEAEIILLGDIMLGRSVMVKSLSLNDPNYPFLKVQDQLREADLVFGNLENPIVEDCPWTSGGMQFCAESRMLEGLVSSNIRLVNLANNHTRNYGQSGLTQTTEYLTENGIEYVGLDNLVIKEIGGTAFGFLGFDFVSRLPQEKDFQLVKESNQKADVLIVTVHWGNEYQARANQFQEQWAEELVKNGADVVVGHHPHWVQNREYLETKLISSSPFRKDIEEIIKKPVYYSLGNFVFDQMWSEPTKTGLAIKLTFENGELIDEEELPIYMSSWAQPEFTN